MDARPDARDIRSRRGMPVVMSWSFSESGTREPSRLINTRPRFGLNLIGDRAHTGTSTLTIELVGTTRFSSVRTRYKSLLDTYKKQKQQVLQCAFKLERGREVNHIMSC